MGKQYNKGIKKQRRLALIKRRKVAAKAPKAKHVPAAKAAASKPAA